MRSKKGRAYKLKGEADIARIERRLARLEAKRNKEQPPPPPPPQQPEMFENVTSSMPQVRPDVHR